MWFDAAIMNARVVWSCVAAGALACADARGAALDQWTYRSSGISGSANFSAVTYGGGKFVVAGNASGTVLVSSDDGATWTRRPHGATPQIYDLTYGNDRFVGVGSAGTVVLSADGESWSSLSVSNTSTVTLYSVTFGNGLFVSAGDYDSGNLNYFGTIYTSRDGVTWSNWTSAAASNLRDVAYGNGRFVALGHGFNRSINPDRRVLVSANGSAWVPHDAAGYSDLRAITYGNGQFVAMARQGNSFAMLTSPNGEVWTPHLVPLTNYHMTRIGFGNGTYVAVGSFNQSRHVVLRSTNGANWQVTHIGPQSGNYFLYDVAFGEGTFVVVGQPNAIAQSTDVRIPWFERVTRANGITELDIGGEVGRGYQLQYSSDLEEWHDLVTYTNELPTVRVRDTSAAGEGRRFYRAQ